MYIIELFAKLLKKKKKAQQIEEDDDSNLKCSHIFMSIDSTNDYLACNKCGTVIENPKKSNFVNKNIFIP